VLLPDPPAARRRRPLPPALWHRLGRVLLTLLAIYVAAMVLSAG